MRVNVAYLPALAALASASPLNARQNIDFDVVDAAPDVSTASIPIGPTADAVTYNLPEATQEAVADPLPVKAIEKRDACSVQPAGAGPISDPDTADAFLASTDLSSAATGATIPSGYYNTFSNLKASSSAYGYMGYTTLDSYDTVTCASKCDDINGCLGFNIFYERDPSVEPGTGCENPASTTVIKCVFWGGYVEAAGAKNEGQWRSDFHVVIAGSNGYMKSAVPTVSGYTGTALGDKTINAPLDCNSKDTYMGFKMFTTSIYDPSLCAAACESQNEYNTAHPPSTGKPMICKFFATYMMAVNGSPEGQACVMYTEPWAASYATNDGQYRGSDHYTIGYAFAYSNDASPGVPVCPADIEYLKTAGADFCTAYNSYTAPVTTATRSTTTFQTRTASATATAYATVYPWTTTLTTTSYTTTAWVDKRSDAAEATSTISNFEVMVSVFPNITESATSAPASATDAVVARRAVAVATPASISNWEAASISAACSSVATGTSTTYATDTITSQTTVATVTATVTSTASRTATATATVLARQGTNGRCGADGGYQSCGTSACCSYWGWCGGGDDWCRKSYGCQSAFGKCT